MANLDTETINEVADWMETIGYDFDRDPDGLWFEQEATEHRYCDIMELMVKYAASRTQAIDREPRPATPVDTALGGHSSDNASEGFTILSTALGPAIEVHPEYHKATDTDKLLCLQNVQSWIDGERKRLRTPTESKE